MASEDEEKESTSNERSSTERRHHYVPRFLLSGFTEERTNKGRLWVFDTNSLRSWPSNPIDAGHIRDFYRIDVADADPLAVERTFSKIEDYAAPVVRALLARAEGGLNDGTTGFSVGKDELNATMNLVALQILRVPAQRDKLDRFNTDIVRLVIEATISSDKTFDAAKKTYQAFDTFSVQDVRDRIDDPNFSVSLVPTSHIKVQLANLPDVAAMLAQRQWGVITRSDPEYNFVCSDNPVSIISSGDIPLWGTGLATPGSIVFMPLSSRNGLWGTLPDTGTIVPPVFGITRASNNLVCALNSETGSRARRYVYAGSQDFVVLGEDGSPTTYSVLREMQRSEIGL